MLPRLLALLLGLALPASVRFNETREECEERYGRPIHSSPDQQELVFHDGLHLIKAIFDKKNRATKIIYMVFKKEDIDAAVHNASRQVTPEKPVPLTVAETEKILQGDVNKAWILQRRGLVSVWHTKDLEHKATWLETEGTLTITYRGSGPKPKSPPPISGRTLDRFTMLYGSPVHQNKDPKHYYFAHKTVLIGALLNDREEGLSFTYMDFGEDGILKASDAVAQGLKPKAPLTISLPIAKKIMKFHDQQTWTLTEEDDEKKVWISATGTFSAVHTKSKLVIANYPLLSAYQGTLKE